MTFRTVVKHVIERGLVTTGGAAIARQRLRRRTLILAYHNVVPDGQRVQGDSSLHLPQRRFAQQLELLTRIGEIVPLSTVFDAPRRDQRPRFVLTFDDAYLGALTAGVDELRRRGLPGTIFVAPGLLGQTTWWDELADASGAVPELEREHALRQLRGSGQTILEWAYAKPGRRPATNDLPRIGTLDELRTAMAYDGLSLASHTWSHPNLTALRGETLQREVTAPARWLEQHFADRFVRAVSYPYGLTSPDVERATAAAGYEMGLRVDGGWMRGNAEADRFMIPRFNVPKGLSEPGFELRMSGVGTR